MIASAFEPSGSPIEKSNTSKPSNGGSEPSTTEKMANAAHQAVDVAAKNFEQAEKALREANAPPPDRRFTETAEHAQALSGGRTSRRSLGVRQLVSAAFGRHRRRVRLFALSVIEEVDAHDCAGSSAGRCRNSAHGARARYACALA